jgi:LPS sulfotransferase NodH
VTPSSAPLLVTGTVRSGTTLLARMLSAHADIMAASDPYLPLFRALRNAIVRESGSARLLEAFPPGVALQDGYYLSERLELLEAIDAATLDMELDSAERQALVDACRSRAAHEAADLMPHMDSLAGDTYRELFASAFDLIGRARGAEGRRWVGVKEVWVLDFFPALLRAFPQARCIVVTRDPRAVLASVVRLAAKRPAERAHPVSVLRHWRKYQALLQRFRKDPLIGSQIHEIRYEDLVQRPTQVLAELCRFLDVDYDDQMVSASNYANYTDGSTWKGNSSYEGATVGISTEYTDKWMAMLDRARVDHVDVVCGPEALVAGYAGAHAIRESWDLGAVLQQLVADNGSSYSWRSDLGDPQLDLAWDLSRYALIADSAAELPADIVRRSFLFPEMLDSIRASVAMAGEVSCAK